LIITRKVVWWDKNAKTTLQEATCNIGLKVGLDSGQVDAQKSLNDDVKGKSYCEVPVLNDPTS
jgi:hypothetical protein